MGPTISVGRGTSIAGAREVMKGYPKGTKIFMAVFFPFVTGLMAFMITANFREVNKWIMPIAVGVGLVIGCILSFFIIIKPMMEGDDEEYNENDARENAAAGGPETTPTQNKTPVFITVLGIILGVILLGCFGYIIIRISQGTWIDTSHGNFTGGYNSALKEPAVIACIVAFVGSILIALIIHGLSKIIKSRKNKSPAD